MSDAFSKQAIENLRRDQAGSAARGRCWPARLALAALILLPAGAGLAGQARAEPVTSDAATALNRQAPASGAPNVLVEREGSRREGVYRETRPDGVTVSIPRDLGNTAGPGVAVGSTDATQGAAIGLPPGPYIGGGGTWPTARQVGPNAAARPNATTRADTTQSYQAFSAGNPDAAVNSAPPPSKPLENPRANRMFLNKCTLAERFIGCSNW